MTSSKLTNEQIKDFGSVAVLICLLIATVSKNALAIDAALAAVVINLTVYKLYTPFAKLWFNGSHALSTVTNKLVLGIVFGALVVPIGFIHRLVSKDSLKLGLWKKNTASVFTDINRTYTAADLENPY